MHQGALDGCGADEVPAPGGATGAPEPTGVEPEGVVGLPPADGSADAAGSPDASGALDAGASVGPNVQPGEAPPP